MSCGLHTNHASKAVFGVVSGIGLLPALASKICSACFHVGRIVNQNNHFHILDKASHHTFKAAQNIAHCAKSSFVMSHSATAGYFAAA